MELIWTLFFIKKKKITYYFNFPEDEIPIAENLIFNLRYAALMCRFHYWRQPEKLPKHDDLDGLASYYKKYYNSVLGKSSVEKFKNDYKYYYKR